MKWTKSSDQLPKQGIYIVWGNDGIWATRQAVFIPEMGWIGSRGEQMHVTHWMSYPDAPEGSPQNSPIKTRSES